MFRLNDCNILKQHIPTLSAQHLKAPAKRLQTLKATCPTLLGATCCVRLATLLRRVATCWVLKVQLVRVPSRNIVGRTWPNDYSIMQHPPMLHEKCDHSQIRAYNTEHVTSCRNMVTKRTQHVTPKNVSICCVEMLRSFGRGL